MVHEKASPKVPYRHRVMLLIKFFWLFHERFSVCDNFLWNVLAMCLVLNRRPLCMFRGIVRITDLVSQVFIDFPVHRWVMVSWAPSGSGFENKQKYLNPLLAPYASTVICSILLRV